MSESLDGEEMEGAIGRMEKEEKRLRKERWRVKWGIV